MLDKAAFMREALPKSIELAVDMHARYDLPTAKRFAKEVEPFKLVWLEEPVPAENIDAMRESTAIHPHAHLLRRKHHTRHGGFRELFEKQAVDIIMPDIQKCGGLAEAKKIADLAHIYYVPIAPQLPGVADRNDGRLPRHCDGAELPCPGMALGASGPVSPAGNST